MSDSGQTERSTAPMDSLFLYFGGEDGDVLDDPKKDEDDKDE